MLRVEPVAHEWLAGGGFALRDLIFVMGERQVDATGVNVQSLAKKFHGHRGALDVPAWAARADRSFPEMLARFRRFPERKIAGTFFFVAVDIDARTGLNAADIDLGKLAVLWKFGDAIVDRAFARVRAGFFLEALNE